MKAGIYKRHDNGKHVYVAKDRGIRAFELTDCHPASGSVKVTTSEKEQRISWTNPITGEIHVADRVADIPNGTTDHDQALHHYVTHVAPMPAGVFKTPNDNLVYVDANHNVRAASLSPSSWEGMSVAYYAATNTIQLCGYGCTHYAEAIQDMNPQEQVDLLVQGLPLPGSTREVTALALPSVDELRSDVQKGEPGVSHLFPGTRLHMSAARTEQEVFERVRSSIADLTEQGVIRYVAGGEYEILDHAAWREFWMSTRLPELPSAGHTAFRPSKAEQWGQGSCAGWPPHNPMTADEIREVFAKASDDVEKYRKAFPMSAAMRELMVQEQNAVMRMHAQTQDLVDQGVIKHVMGDEYMVIDIEASKKEIPEIALMLDHPPCTPLVAADFSKLEERVAAFHPALCVPYGSPGKSSVLAQIIAHNPAPAGEEMVFLEGSVVGALTPAEFFVTGWGPVNDHGWYAEFLAGERPRAVGKQSARKQRKKGRRVWWDAERNTRVWAPK